MKRVEKNSKLGVRVPHNLGKTIKKDPLCKLRSILSRQRNEQYLKNIITGDEKWVVYDNVHLKRLTNINLHNLPQRWNFLKWKLCCLYGGITAVISILRRLNHNQTVHDALYSQQLQREREYLLRKRPAFVNRRNIVLLLDPIYLTPPLGQDMTQGQFFKRSLAGLNSEFSFS